MTSGGIPQTMKAVLITEGNGITITDHPVPRIDDDLILVKTVALSQNPTDFKHVDSPVGKPGTVLGCDFSGIIVKTGKNVKHLNVGDPVAGFVHGGAWPDEGAFAEYVKVPADLVWVVPKSFSHEEACTFGIAFITPVQALFHPKRLGLSEPGSGNAHAKNEWVLVYGGSSAVGQSAIQLLRAAGYKVVTTASPHNFDLVKSLGADEVFDYRDPDVVKKIKQATGDSIKKALDTISLKESQRITAESFGPEGGKMIVLLQPQPDATGRKDVEMQLTLVYTALGRAFDYLSLGSSGNPEPVHYPASKEDKEQLVEVYKKLPKWVEDGVVKPHPPTKVWPGGLNGIQEGLQYMREGKNSGEKIVYLV